MKKLLPLCALFSLAACATPEQLAMQRQQQEQADIATCQSYGLRQRSEAFGMCRLQLDLERQRQYDSHYRYHPRPYFGSGIYYMRR